MLNDFLLFFFVVFVQLVSTSWVYSLNEISFSDLRGFTMSINHFARGQSGEHGQGYTPMLEIVHNLPIVFLNVRMMRVK